MHRNKVLRTQVGEGREIARSTFQAYARNLALGRGFVFHGSAALLDQALQARGVDEPALSHHKFLQILGVENRA